MSDKVLQKTCPDCASQMSVHVPDDEFLSMNIRIFKVSVCGVCGNFKKEFARLAELKREAWIILDRLNRRHKNLKAERAAGSKIENLSMKISNIETKIKTTRVGLDKLNEKERGVSTQRDSHQQQLKERWA